MNQDTKLALALLISVAAILTYATFSQFQNNRAKLGCYATLVERSAIEIQLLCGK